MLRSKRLHNAGFSLIELVIVVVIIGIIGAIAIPRMSRGTEGAADGAVKANLTVLQNALDHYAAEHGGKYPTYLQLQAGVLTSKTNVNGVIDPGGGAVGYIYGPYIRAIPPLPVGPHKGSSAFTDTLDSMNAGWEYTESTGRIRPNAPASVKDASGKAYLDY